MLPSHQAPTYSTTWYPMSRGDTGAAEVATAAGADLIALGWSQDLTPDRAAVVREVLTRSEVPVLLLPCAAADHPSAAP